MWNVVERGGMRAGMRWKIDNNEDDTDGVQQCSLVMLE
jgi:hypothetical protein